MSEQNTADKNTADNWRLEDTGDTLDKWKLQEAEQTQVSPWQLQSGQPSDANWQPVEYERQAPRRGSWVLPLLVGLALVAVFSYGVWIGLGTLGITDFASLVPSMQTEPTPTEVAAALPIGETAPAATITETVAATATTAAVVDTTPPTPEASPTPAPLFVEEKLAEILNQYGVNARSAPSVDGELILVLDQGNEYLVLDDVGTANWVQIAISSTQQGWVSAEFVEVRTEQVLLEAANQRRAALNVPLLEDSSAQSATAEQAAALSVTTTLPSAAITETLTVTNTPPVTATEAPTAGAVLTEPVAPVATALITGTVNITVGLNARSTPVTNTLPIETLLGGAVITVTGRSEDSNWLQAISAENPEIWVFSEYIDLSVAVDTLPVATPGVVPTPPSATTPLSATNTLTDTLPSTTGEAPGDLSASVSSLSGANVRLAPDRNADSFAAVAYDTALPVLGRSADNEWLQVEYEGESVWVLVSTVSLSADVASLPIVTP